MEIRRFTHSNLSYVASRRYAQLATRTCRRARIASSPFGLGHFLLPVHSPYYRHLHIDLHGWLRAIGEARPHLKHGPAFHRPRVLVPRQRIHAARP